MGRGLPITLRPTSNCTPFLLLHSTTPTNRRAGVYLPPLRTNPNCTLSLLYSTILIYSPHSAHSAWEAHKDSHAESLRIQALKGKEDGILTFAYTSTRTNPANCYRSKNSTATSLILPLKNPYLISASAKPCSQTYHLKKYVDRTARTA